MPLLSRPPHFCLFRMLLRPAFPSHLHARYPNELFAQPADSSNNNNNINNNNNNRKEEGVK